MLLCILQAIRGYTVKSRKGVLLEEANILASFSGDYVTGHADLAAFAPSLYIEDKDARVFLLDHDGRVLVDTGDAAQRGKILSAPWILRAFSGENITHETEESGQHFLQAAVPVYSGTQIVGALLVKTSTEELYVYFAHLRYHLVAIGIATCLLLSLFGIFISAIFTVPLSRLTGQIREMSETDGSMILTTAARSLFRMLRTN